MATETPFLNLEQAAARLQKPRQYVKNLVEAGAIPFLRLGPDDQDIRIHNQCLDDWCWSITEKPWSMPEMQP